MAMQTDDQKQTAAADEPVTAEAVIRDDEGTALRDLKPETQAGQFAMSVARALASLKFTVALFAMAIFIVLAGTFAQTEMDIWDVIDGYFRVRFSPDASLGEWIRQTLVYIPFSIFFPASFFPGGAPQLPDAAFIPKGFFFPKGWVIGLLMAVNLLAAHLMRFKIQAKGPRLGAGIATLLLGCVVTWMVIKSGSSESGVLEATPWIGWSTLWLLLKLCLGMLLLSMVGGIFYLPPTQIWERRLLIAGTVVLGAVLAGLLYFGEKAIPQPEAMRILWQLIKATLAGLVLLGGCYLAFKKRAGIVLIHAGIGLMMFSELLVGTKHVETQMQIREGETVNYTQDIRATELAVSNPDGENDQVVVVPGRLLKQQDEISDERLPFTVEILQYMQNSRLRNAGPFEPNPADKGLGKSKIAEEVDAGVGTDAGGEVDISSAYVTLLREGKPLGTFLLSVGLGEQPVVIDGEPYFIDLRFERHYKPYSLRLIDVRKDDYVGTDTPRNYSSDVHLVDPTRNENRQVHIWMNNPLRFAGETFYQSNYHQFPDGTEMTTLQVVKAPGWMIPYVSCMIVCVGLLAHFGQTLLRFLRRRDKEEVSARPRFEFNPKEYIFPGIVLAIAAGSLATAAIPPSHGAQEMPVRRFGDLPIVFEGRQKPIDTLARTTLRITSGHEEYEDSEGDKQPAIRWLLDTVALPRVGDEHEVYKITHNRVLEVLGLDRRRDHMYSRAEILAQAEELRKQALLAEQAGRQANHFQGQVIELARGLRRSSLVIDALSNPLIELPTAPEDILRTYAGVHALKKQQPPLVVAPQHKVQEWQSYTAVAAQTQLKKLAAEVEAETAEQLAAEIVQRWPRQIAIRGVGETRRFLESQVAESNGKTTFAQAAQSMAANWPAEFVRDIARQFEKSPGASDAQIVDSLQPATVLALHEQGVGNLVDMVVKDKLFAEFRSKLQEALQARGQANGPEDINAYLQVILQTAIDEILGDARVDEPINPSFEHLSALFDAYREDDAETFGDQLQAYQAMLAEEQPGDVNLAKVRFEAYFNQLAPFYLSCLFYLFAFVLAVVAWLGWSRPLNRAAFWLIVFSLLLHTFALCGRIYISGRPPVTNLYSSALFIGWGCVVFGLVMELIYRLGIGNVVASLTGFGALLVGHLLTTMPEHRGDTLNVLQAVLDTQVWLATHVVCITLGYATTFLAGMLACIYIIGHWAASIASGLGNRDAQVTPRVDKAMVRMIYGALCFALFFSIIGTVLGGLWADDSWGRFWGWDPKENGALIIVLWNALVLHARWDGMVKDRGLAVLAVAGNICTAWSWFGVNELGVGLHSYGFTEGVLLALSVFVLSQLTIMGLGMLPREMWMTTANAAAPAGGTGARREGKPTDDAERLSSSGNHGGRRKKKRRNR